MPFIRYNAPVPSVTVRSWEMSLIFVRNAPSATGCEHSFCPSPVATARKMAVSSTGVAWQSRTVTSASKRSRASQFGQRIRAPRSFHGGFLAKMEVAVLPTVRGCARSARTSNLLIFLLVLRCKNGSKQSFSCYSVIVRLAHFGRCHFHDIVPEPRR